MIGPLVVVVVVVAVIIIIIVAVTVIITLHKFTRRAINFALDCNQVASANEMSYSVWLVPLGVNVSVLSESTASAQILYIKQLTKILSRMMTLSS